MKPLLAALLLTLTAATVWSGERTPWTTSRVQGSPEPPKPWVAEVVWPHLTFDKALDIARLPSRDLMFLVQQHGKILILPADLSTPDPQPEECADLKAMLPEFAAVYGMAFHPNFESNGQVFLFYILHAGLDPDRQDGTRISRFLLDRETLRLLPETEETVITFPGGGHNGGHLGFGPDGMLYILSGDARGPAPPDPLNTGQDISDLPSSVLRIDVDGRQGDLAYGIPPDNPFLGVKNARPEVWAYGFRNPWKLCFHPRTGDLWVGDVGWELWEFLYRVERGSNFGWSIVEGPQPIKPMQDMGPSIISPPTVMHPHTEMASITCGYVYEGSRTPELAGALIYGDFETGQVWGLWHDGKTIQRHENLADTRLQIVSFGQASGGEVVFLDWHEDQHLHRLAPNTAPDRSHEFPRKLSDTGLFTSVPEQSPAAGVAPFETHAEMWQDGATSDRWIAIPGHETIAFEGKVGKRVPNFAIPENTILGRTTTFAERKVETQLLHYDGSDWNGYSYRWNEAGTDAELVPAGGEEAEFPGGLSWRYPSRAECARCHNIGSQYRLAFQPGLLNLGNQLEHLHDLALVDENFVNAAPFQPAVSPHEKTAPLDQRARTWLSVNCAHCHRRRGGGSVTMEIDLETAAEAMYVLDVVPVKGDFGIPNARIIAPGSPWKSILYYRTATEGPGHMPLLGARTIDQPGLNLLRDWILSLGQPDNPDLPPSPRNAEEALILADAIANHRLDKPTAQRVINEGLNSTDAAVRGLFLRFHRQD